MNLHGDPDFAHSKAIFPQDAPAYDDVPQYKI